jgi:signal peptidase I
MHVDDNRLLALWPGEFEILRKPPDLVLAMRRIVYDNDHPATDVDGSPRWHEQNGAGAWAVDEAAHSFKHAAADGRGLAWLRYRHLIARDGRDKPELITDFMGYNSFTTPARPEAQQEQHWVGDLMIDCEVTIERPQGTVVFELSHGADRFRAVFDVTDGTCTLRQIEDRPKALRDGDAGKVLATMPTALKQTGRHHVRFVNVDDRLLVWVDRELPFGDGVVYTPSGGRGPGENDLEPAGIGARAADVSIGKLQLWRDTYYTQLQPSGRDDYPSVERWSDPASWDSLQELKPLVFYAQPGHYFCLGDNSAHSSDSRVWGLVPERLLRGRAVLTYYPPNRWGLLR